jgi:hypothetical protein
LLLLLRQQRLLQVSGHDRDEAHATKLVGRIVPQFTDPARIGAQGSRETYTAAFLIFYCTRCKHAETKVQEDAA